MQKMTGNSIVFDTIFLFFGGGGGAVSRKLLLHKMMENHTSLSLLVH